MPDDRSSLRELASKFKAAEEHRRKVSRDPDHSVTATLWQAMSNLAETTAAEVERVDKAHQALLDELWKMYYGAEPKGGGPAPMPGIVQRLAEIEGLLGIRPRQVSDNNLREPPTRTNEREDIDS